jgi:hypothetical protein
MPFMPKDEEGLVITPERMVGNYVSEKVHLTKGTGKRIIKLIESLNDSELEWSIKCLHLEREFVENFEHNCGKRATTAYQAFRKKREEARNLAMCFIATSWLMVNGSRKILGMSFGTMRQFMKEKGIKLSREAKLAWDLRITKGV